MDQKKPTPKYTAEFRERGIRLFREQRPDHTSEWGRHCRLRLLFFYRRTGQSLLVAEGRLDTTGHAVMSRSRQRKVMMGRPSWWWTASWSPARIRPCLKKLRTSCRRFCEPVDHLR